MIVPNALSRRKDWEELNILTYKECMPEYLEKGVLPEEEELV
jgi:hypothetical protein